MTPPETEDLAARYPVGLQVSRDYTLSNAVYTVFMAAFEDTNALHVDDEYAVRHGFRGRVAHGAILNGFVSHFIGVCFPAGACILHGVDIAFRAPNYLGDELRLEAEVEQVSEAVRVLVLRIVIRNLTQQRVSAKAVVRVGLL